MFYLTTQLYGVKTYGKGPFRQRERKPHGLLFPIRSKGSFICTIPDRITHTTAFFTPVMEHWLERETAQWVHHEVTLSNACSDAVTHNAPTVQYMLNDRVWQRVVLGTHVFTGRTEPVAVGNDHEGRTEAGGVVPSVTLVTQQHLQHEHTGVSDTLRCQ